MQVKEVFQSTIQDTLKQCISIQDTIVSQIRILNTSILQDTVQPGLYRKHVFCTDQGTMMSPLANHGRIHVHIAGNGCAGQVP